eukprot:8170072-Alexandrium_andersonii.AAC.1
MGRDTDRVAGPSGQRSLICPNLSLGRGGPSPPNRPDGPLRGSETEETGAPLFGGKRRSGRALRDAS